ncbi:MAG: glucuronate isomerase [Veillonellaceae bacterium]|nr:glucuronate isomerase [Veillonellaceae bacterium]
MDIRNETGKLYATIKDMPVMDFCSFLDVNAILENRRFRDAASVFLDDDRNAWRFLRACGVAEKSVTDRSDTNEERFKKFADLLPLAAGSPLYSGVYLVLRRFFDIREVLDGDTASSIWDLVQVRLDEGLTVRDVLSEYGVKRIAVATDPAASVEPFHKALKAGLDMDVVPAFNANQAMWIDGRDWDLYMQEFAAQTGSEIETMEDVKDALLYRMRVFATLGCKTITVYLENAAYRKMPMEKLDDVVGRVSHTKGRPTAEETEGYNTELIRFLARKAKEYDWVLQLRFGKCRNVSTRGFASVGSRKGYTALGHAVDGGKLAQLLDSLDCDDILPRIVLSSANPYDNAVLASLTGAFPGSGVAGTLQVGLTHVANQLARQLDVLADYLPIGISIGPAIRARTPFDFSAVSEWRYALCRWLVRLADDGRYPLEAEPELAARIVYGNLKTVINE